MKKLITLIRKSEEGYSLSELMVVLVIIGVLAMIAIPYFMGVMNKAYSVEAKEQLQFVKTLQEAHFYEYSVYTDDLSRLGFEQRALITEDGAARYKIEIEQVTASDFVAVARAVVDFDQDGTFNLWEISKEGIIRERVPD